MINPLQAMAQARQANQMGGLGVQSQGAQQMTPLLQQSQMNVANPQMMQAQPARLMEMDKYRYVNAAQDRALADKQLLFKTLDAKEQRAHALQAQQNAYNLGLKLEQEKARMKKEQDDAMTALADKRYGPLREKTARVIEDYNNWIGGGSQTELQNRFKESAKSYALQTIPYDEVKQRFFVGPNAQYAGVQPPPFGSDVHKALALQMLQESEQGLKAINSIYAKTQQDINMETQSKTAGYRAAMDGLTKLRFSLPVLESIEKSQAKGGPITIENRGIGSEQALPGLSEGGTTITKTTVTSDDGTFAGKDFNPLVADIPLNIAEGVANTAKFLGDNPASLVGTPAALSITEVATQDGKQAQYQEGLEKELDAKQGETDKVKKDGSPKKLSPKAMEQVRKKIAPEVMLEHAKKIDPKGLGKKDLDYFKSIKEEDFGKLVAKSRGGWVKRLGKYGLDKVMVPDPDTGKQKMMSIKDLMSSKIAKVGGIMAISGLIIDAINYSQAPTAEEKQEMIDITNAHMKLEMIDGEIKVINTQMSDDQRTRLNALMGQSPLAPQMIQDRIAELEAKEETSEPASGLQPKPTNTDLDQAEINLDNSLNKLRRHKYQMSNYTDGDPQVQQALQAGLERLNEEVRVREDIVKQLRVMP